MAGLLKTVEPLERPVAPDGAGATWDDPGYSLKIMGVYQDEVTRDWAMQNCHRLTQLAGKDSIQNIWYSASSLGDPSTFLDAVRAALVAHVIMISVHAADELPVDLYVWVAAWLPRRSAPTGTLTALIGVNEPLDSQSVRTHQYLQAVARRGRLDFIARERRRPGPASVCSAEPTPHPAHLAASEFQQIEGPHYDAWTPIHPHGGLND